MPKNNQKLWTVEQNHYLELNIGVKSFTQIAKKLGRSPKAIQRQAEKLGISNTKVASGKLSVHMLATALNLADKTVKKLIVQNGLPTVQFDFRYNSKDEKQPKRLSYYIDIQEFWNWAKDNKQLINWYKVEKNALPLEPEWIAEQRKADYYDWGNQKKLWNRDEDNLLWNMYYQQGLSQKEIAENLSRTVAGVQRRLKRLRDKRLATA